jgi:putative aldouronate transport system permease protein
MSLVPVSSSRSKTIAHLQRTWMLYVMLLPAFILLAIFAYYPMYGEIMAFEKFNPGLGFFHSPWVGFANFQRLFDSPAFPRVISNTIIIAVAKLIVGQISAVALALSLNEIRILWFKRFMQNLVYMPHFLSWVVLGGILMDILAPSGLVGKAQTAIGLEPIIFLGNNDWFRPTLILSNLWKEVGWGTIIYLAALTGIDPGLYEAAAIDGADRFQRIRYISIPSIMTTIILLACLNLGNILQAGFEQVFNLYNPTVYATGDIIDTYVYRMGLLQAQYGVAAAAGLFKSIIGLILIIVAYRMADKFAGYKIF